MSLSYSPRHYERWVGPLHFKSTSFSAMAATSTQEHASQFKSTPEPGESASPLVDSERRILVVDDEPDIRTMLQLLLDDEGYTTTVAVDGVDGLSMIKASLYPLVVLLDYKMPRMNGAELMQAVLADPKEAGRHAFILITANQLALSPELRQLLREADIPVVEKPFSFTLLLQEIERAIGNLRGFKDDSGT